MHSYVYPNLFDQRDIENTGQTGTNGFIGPGPTKNDLAVIMFTSGSTGNPKGVKMTHGNVVEAIQKQPIYPMEIAGTDRISEETYCAYLPAAHILELNVELMMLTVGVKIGFSSPMTLLDTSPKIAKGGKGDLTVLKPTVLGAVPLVLDRIYKVFIKLAPLK